MARQDVDVLVLGREGNARFVSGATRLWLAGTRPFAPGCVVVRETGAVHLMSVTDFGVPAEIPPARLYPMSWNPVNIMGAVAAIPGVSGARRIADGDLVAMSAGVLLDGWEGSLARTRPCGAQTAGHGDRRSRWGAQWAPLVHRCQAGASVGDLRATAGASVHGVGLGAEALEDDAALEPGMVV